MGPPPCAVRSVSLSIYVRIPVDNDRPQEVHGVAQERSAVAEPVLKAAQCSCGVLKRHHAFLCRVGGRRWVCRIVDR